MPNEWIEDKPKDSGWLDKKDPVSDPALKTLKDLNDKRQLDSETPKPEPVVEPPTPIEDIPYDRIASALQNASNDALDALSRLEKASVNLRKVAIVVPSSGDKGKMVLDKSTGFQSRIDSICMDLKKISEEIATYKNSLPRDTASQI